ncbi:MAG: Ig-like domain-containing protein, partial [Verrucomicrobia bacterium]|nr:Ig-like domain-containing protein [Verrucomicrobiota bacterium]
MSHRTLRGQVLVPDLRIDSDDFIEVFVGGTFDVTFRIFNDGTEEIFAGESITWAVEVNGPDGQAVPSLSRTGQILTGLPMNQSTPDETVSLRMPWAQAAQWSNNARWTIATSVVTPRDVNGTNNRDTSTFSLVIPDVTLNNLVGPVAARPGRNVSVSGTVANVGRVQTQPNVYFRVEARLLQNGTEVDKQSIVLPNQSALSPFPFDSGDTIDFTINELFIPIDGNGTYDVIVNLDAGSPDILIEHTENNNQATVQFDVSSSASIQVVDGSFFSDTGTFQGMAPAHFRFAVRNVGTGPVGVGDAFQATIALSRDQSGIDADDFILREFDLGGSGLGLGLRPNETVTLDWIQRLPDSFEGDFYIVANLDGQTFVSQPTPSITLRSNNSGDTISVSEGKNSWSSRPSYDQTGRYVAFESSVGGIVNIFLLDTISNQETQVTRSFNNAAADGSSFAPSLSADGKFLAFHSSASNLVPGDTNDHTDVFLFDREANGIFRLSTSVDVGSPDGGSYYPSVNGDGSVVAFESLASDLSATPQSFSGSNIFVWDSNGTTLNKLSPITAAGDFASLDADISEDGNRVVFTSYATNFNLSNLSSSDNNEYSDIFLWERNTSKMYLASVTSGQARTTGGASSESVISGDGKVIAYRSSAKNLVTEKGISTIEIKDAGVGYTRTPSIAITDASGLGSGATAEAEINTYGEIIRVSVLLPGKLYKEPRVTVVPDPADVGPSRLAILEARLTHPEGDVYRVPAQSLIDGQPEISRASESVLSVGGDKGSREPTLNYDGSLLAYSTQASNLLVDKLEREDRRVFPNATFRMARARAVIGGPIGEIEVQNSGEGYQDGQLRIEDLSGSGSGALALYHVDNYGRIADISIFNSGNNYDYSQTMISIDNPRAGTGFQLKDIRHQVTSGIGNNRSGGGTILRLEMDDNGLGYTKEQILMQGAGIIIDGDGADLDNDGKPDAKVNPDRIHLGDNGEVFLEQQIRLVVQSTVGLHGATLTVTDHLKTEKLTFDAFSAIVVGNEIGISGQSVVGIRDAIADALEGLWPTDSNASLYEGLQIDEPTLGADFLVVKALGGRAISGNPSSLTATMLSNMLVGGTGFTRATPIIAPDPVVFGFSEINTNISSGIMSNGRPALLVNKDQFTDDIYLYDHSNSLNERITTSKFGLPVNYRTNATTTMPSNRFPSITGNGRFISYSSDVQGAGGLLFGATNQTPSDNNGFRDVYVHDRKTEAMKTPSNEKSSSGSLSMLYPNPSIDHSFPSNAFVPVIVETEIDRGFVSRVDLIVNGSMVKSMDEHLSNLHSGRFFTRWDANVSGIHSIAVAAYDNNGILIAETQPVEVSVGNFSGSLPPSVSLSAIPYDSITSTSTIPLQASGADSDGDFKGIQFYVEGQPYGNEILRFPTQNPEAYIYSTTWKPATHGVYSIFAIGRDNSGNYVASDILNIASTTGSTPPLVNFTKPYEPIDYKGSTLSIASGSITDITLGHAAVGGGYFNTPRISLFGSGSGARAEAILDLNQSSDNYGRITGITVLDGGSGYETASSSFSVTPVVKTIRVGRTARINNRTIITRNDLGIITNIQTELTLGDGGDGYVVPPNLFLSNGEVRRLPIVPVVVGASTGGVDPAEAGLPQILPGIVTGSVVGGFAYSPLNLEVNASDPDGFVRQVDFVVDGVVVASDRVAPFNLEWTPGDAKEYQISALAKDDNGNIGSSETVVVSIEEGIGFMPILSFDDNRTNSIPLGSEHILTVRAFDDESITNVEFFKNGRSIGFADKQGASDYYSQVVSFANDEEGDAVFSAVTRDTGGNQVGTFSRAIAFRLHKTYRLLPAKGATPPTAQILGPLSPVKWLTDGERRSKRQRRAATVFPTNPTFSLGAAIPIVVQATAATGASIAEIQFFGNGVPLPSAGGTSSVINQGTTLHNEGRYVFDWVPNRTGTYIIEIIAIDNFGNQRVSSLLNPITIIDTFGSQSPGVTLMSPVALPVASYTSTSSLRFMANAADTDGDLVGLQFFVDGMPYGDPILRGDTLNPSKYPYSIDWSPGSAGVFTVSAVCWDNSGNYISSGSASITTTTGSTPPTISVTKPSKNLELDTVDINATGSITGLSIKTNDSVFTNNPVVSFAGSGTGAAAEVVLNQDGTISHVSMTSSGTDYAAPQIRIRPSLKSVTQGIPAIAETNLWNVLFL